jgi:drug/metabolite transporter (DMT)-like permease
MISNTRNNLRGIILMILATACLTGMHGMVRYAATDLHPFEIAFFRNLLVPFFLLPWLIRAGWESLRPRRMELHFWRAVIGVIALLAWFYSLSLLPLAEATALNFSSTLFATLGAALILREKVQRYRWLATTAGFVGVLIILQPGRDAASLGGVLVVVSSFFWAGSLLMAKSLTRHDSTLGIVVLMATISALLSLPPALLVWTTPTIEQFGLLLVIAALGTLGYVFYTQALREAEASVVFPLDFVRLLWAVLFGYLVFGEFLDLAGWIGALLIGGSAAYIGYREGRSK